MTTNSILNIPPKSGPSATSRVELSRGARQFGIAARVFLPKQVLTEYEEIDPLLGRNAVGMVLAVLSSHLLAGQVGLGDEVMTICLRRKSDGRLVDVDLRLRRSRDQGQECLTPCVVAEREAELQEAQPVLPG